jgi:integrase
MPKQPRVKTRYPGVYYIEGTSTSGRSEKLYYIHYRKNGKLIEEKAGHQFRDDMTAAKAAKLRTLKIEGDRPTNQERRDVEQESKDTWTLNRLWETYKTHKPGLKGLITDENRYCKHIKPILGDKEPAELTPFDLDRIRLRMLKTHTPGTVKNVLELVRRLANFGVKKHLCPGPSFVIEMPKVNNLKTEDLKPDQLTALLEAIEQDPNVQDANFMKMVLFTGMRRGELFKLQWQDLDFDRGFVHIRDPKGGQDQKIPLNSPARQLLLEHPRTDSPFVFPGRGGRQRVDINKQVNRIKQQAGLPKEFRALHGLRHVYASMLASSGQVDLFTLQKLLTHKSPAMTQRYAHLRDEALRKASDLAGDIIEGLANGNGRQDKVEEAQNR